MDVREVLATRDFWFIYQQDDELVNRFVADGIDYRDYSPLTIRLESAPPFAIEIDIQLEISSIDLGLVDQKAGQRLQLGWWDDARWHPFALRWEEVEALVRLWHIHPTLCPIGTSAALLLLTRFVGNGVDEATEFAVRKVQVAAAYHHLSLFSPAEVDALTESTLLQPLEDDYRWTKDASFGWVFGGEYSCYSTRNAAHAHGNEKFPFCRMGSPDGDCSAKRLRAVKEGVPSPSRS